MRALGKGRGKEHKLARRRNVAGWSTPDVVQLHKSRAFLSLFV
jgi:hypothetical protein